MREDAFSSFQQILSNKNALSFLKQLFWSLSIAHFNHWFPFDSSSIPPARQFTHHRLGVGNCSLILSSPTEVSTDRHVDRSLKYPLAEKVIDHLDHLMTGLRADSREMSSRSLGDRRNDNLLMSLWDSDRQGKSSQSPLRCILCQGLDCLDLSVIDEMNLKISIRLDSSITLNFHSKIGKVRGNGLGLVDNRCQNGLPKRTVIASTPKRSNPTG